MMATYAKLEQFTDNLTIPEQVPKQTVALGQLAVREQIGTSNILWYRAAEPGYPGNFTRDSLTTALLIGNEEMLEHQIFYSAYYQGVKYDALTGEEPGKIHHELLKDDNGNVGGVEMNGSSTAYNACDTTAQFLQGLACLSRTQGTEVLDRYADNIDAAIGYIKSHVQDGLFVEMPMHGEAGRTFGLKVTYWKDSRLNMPGAGEPRYPIAYSLAHFQNAEALQLIGNATGRPHLVDLSDFMFETGIKKFWKQDHFAVAIDGVGGGEQVIDPPSSDSLHTLLYIPPDKLPDGYAQEIVSFMRRLKTNAGYRSGLQLQYEDDYHTAYVWTHEQALLHAAAKRHALGEAQAITSRVLDFFNGDFPELVHAYSYEPGGNSLQLWAYAASEYLQNPDCTFYKPA